MSITLLTAVPGGGKTAYAVWHVIKKAQEEGKVIYTCGIPKLTIPTIEVDYEKIHHWHESELVEELPVLNNFDHGSIIVIDEVQKMWPATGSKLTEDIKALSEHRHFGLTFFIITQSPTLIHRNVLALVDRHLHIRPTWAGRRMYEWPEFCRNPSASSNKAVAIPSKYKLPVEAFALYHSATQHVKPQKRIPGAFYVFLLAIVVAATLGYFSYSSVMAKTKPADVEVNELFVDSENKSLSDVLESEKVEYVEPIAELLPVLPTLVSNAYLWAKIGGCLDSEAFGCVCYGKSAERLVIPLETCKLATKHGWTAETRRSVSTTG